MADETQQATVDSVTGMADANRAAGGSGTLEVLRGWIKRKLGDPKVRIDLTADQLDDNIFDALNKYTAYANRQPKYWQFITIPRVNVYQLPDDFYALEGEVYYLPNTIVNFVQTFTAYQLYVNFTGNLDMTMFETMMQALQTKMNRIGATPTWEILYNPPRIKLYPMPSDTTTRIPVVFAYIPKIRLEDWAPQTDPVGYDWVRRYALALSKEAQGRIRSRFGDAITAGAQAFNNDGAVLLGEAKEELAKLNEELIDLRTPMMIDLF